MSERSIQHAHVRSEIKRARRGRRAATAMATASVALEQELDARLEPKK